MSILEGSRLGSFEVTSPLGKGGMGEVWRARDTRLGREVAIKVLPDEFTRDSERLARFDREARLLATLNHPHIASIYGLEEHEGNKFLVMELAEGETLADRLDRGQIPVDDTLAIARQVADALEAAHEKGIIHRDLKPGNIVVDADGNVRVLDFGLAKALDADEASNSDITNSPTMVRAATGAGVILGTAAYMSPEQARGKRVDRRADIWAFGVLLWEMLSGRRLFRGETVSDTLAAVLRADVDLDALPADTPPATRWLVSRCLEREPRNRLRDIGEARVLLESAGEMLHVVVQPSDIRAGSTSRAWLWALAGLLSGVATMFAATQLLRTDSSDPVTYVSIETAPAKGIDLGASLDSDAIAISPDGRTIAFAGSSDPANGVETSGPYQQRQLYVRRLDQRVASPLQGTTGARSPFFSSDGRSIYYTTVRDIYRVDVGGGPVRTVSLATHRVFSARPAPDGSILASGFDSEAGKRVIFRIYDDGARVENLMTLGDDEIAGWPQLLPGGKGIVFTHYSGELSISVLDLATGDRTVVAQKGMKPIWSPTGHILFADNGQLLALPFDPDSLTATGSAVPVRSGLSTGVIFRSSHYDVSSNGTLVLIGQDAIDPLTDSLLWMTRDGTTSSLGAEPLYYVDPRLSPDGRFLAVSIPTSDNDIWVHDLERGNKTRLSFGGREDETPIWAPDGGSVAWASSTGGDRSLVRRNRDGSGAEEVLWSDPRHFHCAAWTPDGKTILIELDDPTSGRDVYGLDLGETVEARALLNGPYKEMLPRLSPDGRWLVYVSNESESNEVYMQPYPSLDRKVQISVGGGTQPLWSHDGATVYYRGESVVLAVDLNTRASEPVVSRPRVVLDQEIGFGKGEAHWGYDVAADGRFLVTPDESRFYPRRMDVVIGWFQELKHLMSAR